MAVLWGIHNNQPALDLIEGQFVAIGWDELGDLTEIGPDRDAIKSRIFATYPSAKPGAIPVWAGVILRFMDGMAIGDIVVSPNKADSTLNFGEIVSDFYVEPSVDVHRNRRRVKWLQTGVPRATFSQGARYEVGSAVTLFQVKNHADEFMAHIYGVPFAAPSQVGEDDSATESAVEEPSADRIETYSRDFVIDVLKRMDPYRFEHFTAALLEAMGYVARVTQASGDGGVDVIAYRDPLGLEPPIIKVQCKRTVGTIGGPDVQKLAGALAHGGSEVGLFVTLGTYSSYAIHL